MLAPLLSGGCLRLTGGGDETTTGAATTGRTTSPETASATATEADTATDAETATETATEAETESETETETDTETGPGDGPAGLEPVVRHALDGSFADSVNDVDGQPAASGLAFVDDDRGTVLDFRGRGAGSQAGYYDLPYDALGEHFDVGDPVTTAFWMAPAALDDWYAVSPGSGITVSLRNGNVRVSRYNTRTGRMDYTASVAASRVLDAGAWHHVVATLEPGAEARLFVDGTEAAATDVDADQGYQERGAAGIDAVRMGFPPSGDDGAYDGHFEGRLDDVRFYRGSVDAAGAEALYDEMRR